VLARPPPEASVALDLVLELAYAHRYDGLTYGAAASSTRLDAHVHASFDLNGRPPDELEGSADATWTASMEEAASAVLPPLTTLAAGDSLGEYSPRDLYSILITDGGAAVMHQTKKIGCISDSSHGNERYATSRLAEAVAYAREIKRALGAAPAEPTLVVSDNLPNVSVAMRKGAANRAKHMLRRYYVLMQRIRAGEITVCHVKDEENPADFLTKWVPAKKLKMSLAYATGAKARAAHHAEERRKR
jgi:hypothetical protein